MREILFRGKRVDNGEWIYGNYIEKIDPTKEEPTFWASLIHDKALTAHKVIPESVGQFTGLFDKNGKEIYEGDIVQHDAWDYPFGVIFNDEKARFVCKLKTGLTQYIDYENLVVVGDVY